MNKLEFDDETEKEVCRAYKDKTVYWSLGDLATWAECSVGVIRRMLARRGVEIRTKGGRRPAEATADVKPKRSKKTSKKGRKKATGKAGKKRTKRSKRTKSSKRTKRTKELAVAA